jgi:RNA polymerase-interacting CarD/CdnL/TRCF family regulator
MSRRAHRPDSTSRRQVEAMAAYGVAEAAIARVLTIDPKTLRKHYRDELDTGQIKATAKVAESLFRKATTDGAQSVTAAIFWLKTRGGWRESPQSHQVEMGVRNLSEISDEELERLIGTLQVEIADGTGGAGPIR